MQCPECGSDRVIVLVHSLQALCGACMKQWVPGDDDEASAKIARSAAALSRTFALDLTPASEGEKRSGGAAPTPSSEA
jgi:hypothetical protein